MKTTTMRREYLQNTTEGHNKDYELTMEKVGGDIVVTARWGRIENDNKQEQVKYRGPSATEADSVFIEIIQAKRGKGYIPA